MGNGGSHFPLGPKQPASGRTLLSTCRMEAPWAILPRLSARHPSLEGGGSPKTLGERTGSVPGSRDPCPARLSQHGSRAAQMLSGWRLEASGALSTAVSTGPAWASGPRLPASQPEQLLEWRAADSREKPALDRVTPSRCLRPQLARESIHSRDADFLQVALGEGQEDARSTSCSSNTCKYLRQPICPAAWQGPGGEQAGSGRAAVGRTRTTMHAGPPALPLSTWPALSLLTPRRVREPRLSTPCPSGRPGTRSACRCSQASLATAAGSMARRLRQWPSVSACPGLSPHPLALGERLRRCRIPG